MQAAPGLRRVPAETAHVSLPLARAAAALQPTHAAVTATSSKARAIAQHHVVRIWVLSVCQESTRMPPHRQCPLHWLSAPQGVTTTAL